MPEKRKMSVVKRVLLGLLLAFMLFIISFGVYIRVLSIDHPPKDVDLSVLEAERLKFGENTYLIGKNWLRKSESGLWECYLEGESFERGAVFGMLTRELLYYQEKAFVDWIREIVPSDFYLKLLKYFVAFFNRNLEKHIIDEYKYEIYGTSLSCDSEYDFIGTGYQRQLNYHAAHDIGHALGDFNMVGCTSFSVWDVKSNDSSLIVGRNFDFYAGDRFAENKIVCFVNPAYGFRFVMITWADMIGVVSGMNEKGLTVTINAAKSSIPSRSSTPVSLLAREILQYAASINEAYEISKKRSLFVSESIMVASSSDGKTVIIEKSPDAYDIVNPDTNWIICSNHFQGEVFANDERNIANINGSDSYARYLRVKELLDQNEVIDIRTSVDILRNQKGLNDTNIGMGNPLAINQLIAHHGVVFKPESLQLWVSSSPYQLGKFVAYDLHEVFAMDTSRIIHNQEIYARELIIPADSFLYSIDYQNYLTFSEMTKELIDCTSYKKSLTSDFVDDYLRLNPDLYLPYVYLGDYYREMKEFDRAGEFYNLALTKEIPGEEEKNKIVEKVEKMIK